MAKENYRDFIGDEKLEELQDKLATAKIKSEQHKMLDEQNKANLELFEKITTDSAVKLADQQSHLTELSQHLNSAKEELARTTELMQQQEMLNKAKAYTLQAAQKELEESQLRYCKTIENVNEINKQIQQYEDEIEKVSIQVKAAYNNWQHNYNHLQAQKLAAEKNTRAAEQLQAQIDNLSQKQEMSKNQAAEQLADTVILNLDQNLDVADLNVEALPKATMETSSAIPEIPPIDDELAKLIQEATNDVDSEYSSLRPQIENSAAEPEPILALENDDTPSAQTASTDNDETAFWENKKAERFAAKDVFSGLTMQENVAQQPSGDKQSAKTADTDNIAKADQTAETTNGIEKSPDTQPVLQSDTINSAAEQQTPEKKKHPLVGYIICIIIAVIIALLLRAFVFQITEISGDSMEPTLTSGERAISSPISYYFDDIQQFDIIVFRAPDRTDGAYYVKRVIGLPGDHVVIANGQVAVNGTVLDEKYLNGAQTEGDINTIVPNNEYFVLGDNRAVSHDSRNSAVGTIKKASIIGKVIYQIYPFNSMGKIQ